MSEFQGKTAVISGGAEGLGLGMAKAMGRQGMNIVIGDIDEAQLAKAADMLQAEDIPVLALKMDVTDIAQWQSVADQALERFGKIHMLINNAGVSGIPSTVDAHNDKDWRWVIDVNLMGVVYGAQAIIPKIKQHGEGGWMINVASMAGMAGVPYAGAYNATKLAVAGLSEGWSIELRHDNIQVSVLCPAFCKTRIHHSTRNKQDDYQDQQAGKAGDLSEADSSPLAAHMEKVINSGLDPEVVGERVLEAIRAKELYIFTHPNYRAVTQERFKGIDSAFARAEKSELISHLNDQPVDNFS